jgi:AraC-like DNA-binding protein
MAFYATMIRGTCGVEEPLAELWLVDSRHRGWTGARREHFGCAVRFDRAINAVVVPSGLLDVRFLSARPDVVPHLSELAARMSRDLSPLDELMIRVADQIRRALPTGGPPSLARTARGLGTSARTLQRRLEQDGRTYGAIVDGVRREVVDGLLARPELTLEVIAERVGYSDTRALRRACRRWFGASPGAYRRQGTRDEDETAAE